MSNKLTSAVNVSISVRKSLNVLRTKAAATTGARLVLSARDSGSQPFRSKIHPWTVSGRKCVCNKMMKIPFNRTLVLKLLNVIVYCVSKYHHKSLVINSNFVSKLNDSSIFDTFIQVMLVQNFVLALVSRLNFKILSLSVV